jgi:hypothetical protein
MSQPLAIVPAFPEADKIRLFPDAEQAIAAALDACALVGRVSNETENKLATDAAVEAQRVVRALEKTREEIVAPALKFHRSVNTYFAERLKPLKEEVSRLTKLTGDYIHLQAAKARAAEQARREELDRLERERQQALAEAKTHEDMDAIQQHYCERRAIETPVQQFVPKAAGQTIKSDLEVVITDIWALAKAQPSCVNPPTPRMSEIKALLRAGVKLPGVEAKETLKVGVRASAPRVIDV